MLNGVLPRAHNQKREFSLSAVGRRVFGVLEKACLPDLLNTKTIPDLSDILKDHFEPTATQAKVI